MVIWYGYGMVMVWYGMEMFGNGMVTLWYGTVWYVMLWYVFIYVYIGGQKKWHKVAGPNIYMYILFDIYICNVCHVSFSSYIYILLTPQILVASQWPLEHCRRHSPGYVLATRFRVFQSVFSLKNHGFDLRGAMKKSWL